MNLKQQLNQLKNIITQAQSALVFLPENPTYDKIAAGLGLYLGLLKQGKLATIATSSPIKVEDCDLVGVDKIKQDLDGKNMIISLPYEEGKIEKVSYNFEGNQFNLIIEPKDKPLSFSHKDVKFKSGGTKADVVVTIGVKNPTEIGPLYHQNTDLFNTNDLVNLDNGAGNSNFGALNIVNPQLPTVSEIIVLVLKNLNIILDKDIATNLYKGMQKGTNDFDPNIVSALTFEAAALSLRSGAQRKPSQSASSAFPAVSRQSSPINKQPKTPTTIVKQEPVKSVKPTTSDNWLKPKIFSNPNGTKN
jgi:hypothetical protein